MPAEEPLKDKQIAAAEAKIKARKQFESVFPLLVDEVVEYLETIHLPENAVEWYKGVSKIHSKQMLTWAEELELQYPWRKIEPWSFCRGHIQNSRRQRIIRQCLLESLYSRMGGGIGPNTPL